MNNAFLVRLSVSLYTARKLDKAATKEAKANAGASEKAGVKVYKSTLAADTLDKVHQIANLARTEHRKRTVPWAYDGPGAITAEGYPAYKAVMVGLERQFNEAVSAFYAVYASEREAARLFLGRMFNELDYPTTDQLGNKFGFRTHCEPIPQADNFAPAGLAPELVAAVKADIVQANAGAIANANNEGWARVIEAVEKLRLRLQEYGRGDVTKFYNSWIDNVKEIAFLLPSINIANDPDLARMSRKLMALTGYTSQDLKESESLRADVVKQATLVLNDIGNRSRQAA